MEKKERIFISYKRVDKTRVDALKTKIEAATGEECWIDRDGIESDAQFVEVIMKAIDQCEVFLFMRSKEHNNITNHSTDWTIREVNYALEEKKRIVFISLDNTPLPRWFKFMFPQQQETDASDATKLEHLYADLRSWLKVWTNYEAKLEKSNKEKEQLALAEAEAQRQTEEARKKQHDIFISYSSKDKPVADAVCHALEESGIPCWIAPRNAIPGIDYEDQIPPAIKSSQAMVLIFSANSNISKYVQSEVRIAFNAKKPIISFVIDSTQMSDRLDYYLGSSHWLVAYPDYREKTCELVASVCRLLEKEHLLKEKSLLREMVNEEAVLMVEPHPIHCHAKTLEGHADTVYSAAFSPDGKKIVSASRDKTIRIWNAETGECSRTLEGHAGKVHSAAFNTDGTRIVSASLDKTIRIWNTETGECSRPLTGHPSNVRSAAFSPDGTQIVSASPDKTIRIWITKSGNCLAILNEHTHWVYYATFSPDGTRIVSASLDKTIRIWDAKTKECINILKGHTKTVRTAIFSPDGKRIVSASQDETVRIWDAQTGECIRTLEGHTNWGLSATFSPDGKRIVSTSLDKTLRIWNAETGKCIRILAGHTNAVYSAAFSPDGKKIVSASQDKTIRIWDISDL